MLGIISLNVLRCLTHSRHSRHPLALTHPRQFKYSSTIEIFSFTIQIFLNNSYVLRQFKYSSANFPRQFKSRRQFKYSLAIQRFWQTFLDNSNICHQFELNSIRNPRRKTFMRARTQMCSESKKENIYARARPNVLRIQKGEHVCARSQMCSESVRLTNLKPNTFQNLKPKPFQNVRPSFPPG